MKGWDRLLFVGLGAIALGACGTVVPFKVETTGGICNTAGPGSANPQIVIDSQGSEPFVVTSILIRTGPQRFGAEGYEFLSINYVTINGTRFDTMTGNLTGAVGGSGINESADLMGTPIRRTNVGIDPEKGGNFPHQIVAEGGGANDIAVQLFCRADDFDLNIDAVLVAGWKPPTDAITVTYVPGD
jgi:hypothetical protein